MLLIHNGKSKQNAKKESFMRACSKAVNSLVDLRRAYSVMAVPVSGMCDSL